MKVVLLEKLNKRGAIGDVVEVADGFARNFLIPQNKALRATKENIAYFDAQKEKIVAENLRLKSDASERVSALNGQIFPVIRQTSDRGQLYGSVTAKDVAAMITEKFFAVDKNQIVINKPIKEKGVHTIFVQLHPEVVAEVQVSVAPSLVEAEKQLVEDAEEVSGSKKETKDSVDELVSGDDEGVSAESSDDSVENN
ncbi:MAG: 50S ribosomal protein L9 [Rickettsiales bacterium]|nr:50S ribosomal protein L9 [Rickettsiales bacterium]|tara:strand:- start:3372 stop:3962 length:591 start_codon:yes stop_codon:yes gene_type:complete